MGISSSALASLVIAGTAIGGSTFAVLANTAPSEINSPSITQITETDPAAKLPGETIPPVNETGNLSTIAPVDPFSTPMPTPTLPVLPPPTFNGEDDDEESEEEGYEDNDEDEDEEEDDD
jgi:hypothetical protein